MKDKSQKWHSERSKEPASLLGHHLHLPQESTGSFSCDSLRPPQFSCSQWPLAPLRRHPQRSVNLHVSGTVSVLKISETKWQEKRKAHGGGDFTKRNCARNERRKSNTSRKREVDDANSDERSKCRLVELSRRKHFFVVCREITYLWAEYERLTIESLTVRYRKMQVCWICNLSNSNLQKKRFKYNYWCKFQMRKIYNL